MPDPRRATVSATEAPMLFNASPYGTRWTLWQRHANGKEIPYPESERMEMGTLMQPILLMLSGRDLKLEVTPEHNYVSRGPLGCTRDATVYCPDRGPGALETKCCFDYRTWMQKWGGGTFVPREIEIQLQVQMFVGGGDLLCARCGLSQTALGGDVHCQGDCDDAFHGRADGCHRFRSNDSYTWGVVAVWVAAQMYYFERKPDLALWAALESEARTFLDSVRDMKEPDPFGSVVELPLLAQIYPTREGDYLDLRDDEAESFLLNDKSVSYLAATTHRRNANKVAESLRAELIAKLKGHEKILIGGGGVVSMGKRNRLSVYVPGIPDLEGDE